MQRSKAGRSEISGHADFELIVHWIFGAVVIEQRCIVWRRAGYLYVRGLGRHGDGRNVRAADTDPPSGLREVIAAEQEDHSARQVPRVPVRCIADSPA